MKIIAIGDIHGRQNWKLIPGLDQADRVVFVGDYFDSFYIDGNTQIENFSDIIAYKKANPKKVRLLLGNHDYHYLPKVFGRYSGYNGIFASQYQKLLCDAIADGLIKIAWFKQGIMFSHAGISKEWLSKRGFDTSQKNADAIQGFVNTLLHQDIHCFDFTSGPKDDPYGNETCQGPLWIRPESLVKCTIDFPQVFGHTQHVGLKPRGIKNLINIDSLEYGQYLIIEDGKMSVGKVSASNEHIHKKLRP